MREFNLQIKTESREDEIKVSDKGRPYSCVNNVIVALLNPKYALKDGIYEGQFFYDTFTEKMQFKGKLAGEKEEKIRSVDDNLINQIGVNLERYYDITYSEKNMIAALRNICLQSSVNVAGQYIESLIWNGDENAIRKLLPVYLGADESELNAWIMEHMLVGIVSRIVNPGCKFDEMMVLVGSQGIGKSTFVRYMAMQDAWYCSIGDINGKDAVLNMMGKAVVEVEEFVALRKCKNAGDAKAFISKAKDTVRIPFDKFSRDVERKNVLVGTINDMEFLSDHTGERRYLPVICDIRKRKRSIYPLVDFLNGMTNSDYEADVKDDFDNAIALAAKIYKEKSHSMTIPGKLVNDLLDVQEACKFENPDVEEIEEFLYVYKPTTKDPYRCCWKEYANQGGKISARKFSEIMVSYFPEWVKHSTKTTQNLYPNGAGPQKRIATKCFYALSVNNQRNAQCKDAPQKEIDTEGTAES